MNKYFSLVKFSHTVFALPFALIGFFLGIESAKEELPIDTFIYVILCMVFARTAAMAFNRFIDRKYDALNPRTASREIPAGVISPTSALWLTVLSSILFISTTFFINSICFYLSPIALIVILAYSYAKRFTPFCHLILGLGLSLAPIGAYLAVTGVFSLGPLLLSFLVFTWVSAFDIIYALQDEEFDSSQKLKSIPVLLGKSRALLVSRVLHVMTGLLVITIGFLYNYHLPYFLGSLLFVFLLFYQHSIVKPNDLSRVNLAFGTTNGIGSVVFGIAYILEILLF